LNEAGKEPSVIERLIKVVIGMRRASRQDLRSLVGIKSEAQDESEEFIMAVRTSSEVAKEKVGKGGTGKDGRILGMDNEHDGGNFEQSVEILSSKNLRKEAARMDGEECDGREDGILRDRRELSVDQSLRG
jgi:hypothetical protein